ncbi:hypothetical protein OROMI_031734 [Orobanche minor]
MEVMSLMLGEFLDDFTGRMVDVLAMPQNGTGVTVEAVDHVFQTNICLTCSSKVAGGWTDHDMMLGQEPRQPTLNLGHLSKPPIQALLLHSHKLPEK